MLAEQLIKDGLLTEALAALQDAVRKDPSNAKYRVFLFQLLVVIGNWDRALTQLNVAGELDAATIPMVQTYREAIQCEALRAEIFSGKRAPMIFGEPQQWIVLLAEALRLDAAGQSAQAARARQTAFDSAPVTTGRVDGVPFEWIADADPRIGPVVEAIVNGHYYWIPFEHIKCIDIDAPVDLRDAVWTAVTFTWTNGGQAVGLVPTRYSGTTESADNGLRLARRTEWHEPADACARGLGQRMFATDEAEYALMDIRQIELDTQGTEGTSGDDDDARETDDTSDADGSNSDDVANG